MSKLKITKKVNETNYYSNAADASRNYDVTARVTIGDDTPIVSEGTVKVKGGDVVVGAFSKTQYDSLRISFAGSEVPESEAVSAITAEICGFINALNEL